MSDRYVAHLRSIARRLGYALVPLKRARRKHGRPQYWTGRRRIDLYSQIEFQKLVHGKKTRATIKALVGKNGWLFDVHGWPDTGPIEDVLTNVETTRREYARAKALFKRNAEVLAELERDKVFVDWARTQRRRP
jgi:hypothetical protein